MDIRRFEPNDAPAVRASMDLLNDASAIDAPWEHPWLPQRFDTLLERGWDGDPPTPYLATEDGKPVGTSLVFTFERDNRHLAWLWLVVHPEHRRRGLGSELFAHMEDEVRQMGRTTLGADGWESERTTAFMARHGLEQKSQAIMRRQHLAELPAGLLQKLYDEAAEMATDYELVRIIGRTPPELMDGLVEITAAINDAPTDDLDVEDEVFSRERLEEYESASIARGHRMYRVIARHKETGELAGHTVLVVEEPRPTVADQHDTAVASAHRGHRLGMLLKAGMLLWMADVEPQIETVDTWNTESNEHMIAVNDALGYRVMGRELQYQKRL